MRIPRLVKIGFFGLLISGVFGVAYAQDLGKTPPPADGSVGMKRDVKLSPEEQLKAADAVLGRIDNASNTVRKQLEQARAQRDGREVPLPERQADPDRCRCAIRQGPPRSASSGVSAPGRRARNA